MTLPLSDIVNVSIVVSPTAAVARGFGVGLLLGSNSLTVESRIQAYTTAAQVLADTQLGAQEQAAANAYFGQSPAPTLLLIGNRFAAAQAGHLRGSSGVTTTLATYNAVTNGGFDVVINGVLRQIFGLNFSAAGSLAAVAAIVQTALAAALASTTCTFTAAGYFLITSPTTGTASTVGYAVAPTGGSSPVDVSTLLGLTQVSGALSVAGIAAESLTQSLTASLIFNPTFYGVSLTSTASLQDQKDAAAFCESNKLLFWNATADANGPISSATSDIGFFFSNLGYNRTVTFWDNVNADLYEAVSAEARMAIVDYTQPNSVATLFGKQLPGYAVVNITETQRLALEAKHYNYYASFGSPVGFAMVAQGVVANGRFIDEVIGLDWLQATVQTAAFNVIATSTTRIPNTNTGAAMIVQGATAGFNAALNNGLIAPGFWTGAPVGEIKTGDWLPLGFYIYAAPVATETAGARAARQAPAITAICIGAGAIQSCSITVTFQR
jgi:hypothetical protein